MKYVRGLRGQRSKDAGYARIYRAQIAVMDRLVILAEDNPDANPGLDARIQSEWPSDSFKASVIIGGISDKKLAITLRGEFEAMDKRVGELTIA